MRNDGKETLFEEDGYINKKEVDVAVGKVEKGKLAGIEGIYEWMISEGNGEMVK